MSSEESFNSSILELHCSRLISLWGKSDASRRALETATQQVRGPSLVPAARRATSTRNKSSYYCIVEDDPETKNSIPSAMRFQYNAKKRNDMEHTMATTTRVVEQKQEQDQDHQSTTITSTKETSRTRRRTLSTHFLKKTRRRVLSPDSTPEIFDGSRNCKTSSKRSTDEQKQKNKTRRLDAADQSNFLTVSSAPAVLSLPDDFDLDSYFTESMEDDQLSLLLEVNLDEIDDSFHLLC